MGWRDRKVTIEELLEKPYWIIDILPKRVPKDSPGQYFAVEDFFLKKQLLEIKKKHINVILKLNCYMEITIDDEKNSVRGEEVIFSKPGDAVTLMVVPTNEELAIAQETERLVR